MDGNLELSQVLTALRGRPQGVKRQHRHQIDGEPRLQVLNADLPAISDKFIRVRLAIREEEVDDLLTRPRHRHLC